MATVDKLGRRPLLLAGVGGLVLSLLALSSSQEFLHGSTATWVSVGGLLAYCACYQVYEANACSFAGRQHSESLFLGLQHGHVLQVAPPPSALLSAPCDMPG